MNNPVRSFMQRFEAGYLRKISSLEQQATVLEIGCGQGVGTRLINKLFKPKKIVAMDLDEKMVARAKKKTANMKNIDLSVGNAASLQFKDKSFDAVFDFGIIHHIPNWQDCVSEIHRVLKPGGELVMEDLSHETFHNTWLGRFLKRVLHHPYEDMFKRQEFFTHLKKTGFKVEKKYENRYWFSLVARKG